MLTALALWWKQPSLGDQQICALAHYWTFIGGQNSNLWADLEVTASANAEPFGKLTFLCCFVVPLSESLWQTDKAAETLPEAPVSTVVSSDHGAHCVIRSRDQSRDLCCSQKMSQGPCCHLTRGTEPLPWALWNSQPWSFKWFMRCTSRSTRKKTINKSRFTSLKDLGFEGNSLKGIL